MPYVNTIHTSHRCSNKQQVLSPHHPSLPPPPQSVAPCMPRQGNFAGLPGVSFEPVFKKRVSFQYPRSLVAHDTLHELWSSLACNSQLSSHTPYAIVKEKSWMKSLMMQRERDRETERERSFIERYLLKLIDDTARAVSERLCHMRRRIHVSYEEDDTCVI